MKAHPIVDMKIVEKTLNDKLNQAYVTGVGYGAKIFANVVKEKIVNFSGENKDALISDIQDFVDTTLSNDVKELSAAFANLKQRTDKLIKTEENE